MSEFRTWQIDADVLVALIEHRHAALTANFNQSDESEETIANCARIQRHVMACYVRDGNGLLRARGNNHEEAIQ